VNHGFAIGESSSPELTQSITHGLTLKETPTIASTIRDPRDTRVASALLHLINRGVHLLGLLYSSEGVGLLGASVKNFNAKEKNPKENTESKSPTLLTSSSLHTVRSHIGLYDLEDQFCLNRVLRVFRSREDSPTPECLKRPLVAVTTPTSPQVRKHKRRSLFPPLDVDFTTCLNCYTTFHYIKIEKCLSPLKSLTKTAIFKKVV
jgi:hypothetical protein